MRFNNIINNLTNGVVKIIDSEIFLNSFLPYISIFVQQNIILQAVFH